MFYPHSNSKSEVKDDQLLRSHLAYWSAPNRAPAEPEPQAWEALSPVKVKAGPWVLFVLAIVIALSLLLIAGV